MAALRRRVGSSRAELRENARGPHNSDLLTLIEVVRARCAIDPTWSFEQKHICEERALEPVYGLTKYPFWRLASLPVPSVAHDPAADADPLTDEYVHRRRSGSPFPPILALPSRKRPGTWWAHDGNHRVAAAKIVGDRFIDAYIPAEESAKAHVMREAEQSPLYPESGAVMAAIAASTSTMREAGCHEVVGAEMRRQEKVEILKRAALWLNEHDPDSFHEGCGDVSVALERFAEMIGLENVVATAGTTPKTGFHAWLEVDGALFDPVAFVEGFKPGKYKKDPAVLAMLVCELFSDEELERMKRDLGFSSEASPPEALIESVGARYQQAGDYVDGLLVRDHVPNLDSIDGYFADSETLPGIRVVPMSDLGNPRSVFYAADDFERAEHLADAISRSGEINPLIIGVDEKGPFIIEGAHRFVALWHLKAKEFPAVVVVGRD